MLDPQMRASDADREAVVGVVQNAEADGRLSAEESANRIAQVHGAKTYAELDEAVRDLTTVLPSEFLDPGALAAPTADTAPVVTGPPVSGVVPGGVPTTPQRFAPAGYQPDNPLIIDAGWSTEKLTGRWTLPPFVTIRGAAGSVHMNCIEAHVETDIVNIEVSGGVGSITVVLPEGWGADTTRVAKSLGSLTNKLQGGHDPGMPLLQFFGKMGMGSLTIRHMDWWERRRHRKQLEQQPDQPPALPRDAEGRELR